MGLAADVHEAQGIGRRPEPELTAVEQSVDRCHKGPAVARRSCEAHDAHSGELLGELLSGEAPFRRDD